MKRPAAVFLLNIGILLFSVRSTSAQWIRAGKPGGGWITALTAKGTCLFAATRQGGVFMSTNKGTTWKAVNSGLPEATDFQCLASSGPNLFVGAVDKGVFMSSDSGASWGELNAGLPEGRSVFRFEVSGTDVFAVAGPKRSTVYLLADDRSGWIPANSGLPDSEVLCLAACGENLFAGTGTPLTGNDACVFLSKDKGTSWKAINIGLPVQNPIYRFAAVETHIFAGTWAAGRVFWSGNSGASWSPVCSGLPDPMDFSLSDLAMKGNCLFLGSFKGVFLSTDKGRSWTPLNSGLPADASVYCFAVGETDLFAGTEEGEIWRLSLRNVPITAYLSRPVITDEEFKEIRKNVPQAAFIPSIIKSVMEEGLATRRGRREIPFEIFKALQFPARDTPRSVVLFSPAQYVWINLPPDEDRLAPSRDSLYAAIFFRANNKDLGYAPQKPDPDPAKHVRTEPVHEAYLDVFVEFRQTDASGNSRVVRELCLPSYFEEDSSTYDPEKEGWYAFGYPLRPGKYTVVMAISLWTDPSAEEEVMRKLEKVGVDYFDIDIPGQESYQSTLETTPIFFVKKLEDMYKPEEVTSIHKGFCKWSRLEIVPNHECIVTIGDVLRIGFYIVGAQSRSAGGRKDEISTEITYLVLREGGEAAIQWIVQNSAAEIDQLLPLKQSVAIRDDQGERHGWQNLPAGKYTLVVSVKDNVTGATVEKRVPFEIKEEKT